MEDKLIQPVEPKVYEQTVQRKYRNYKWVMYCFIAGLSLMFFSLTFMYLMNRLQVNNAIPLKLSPLFYWNTILLLVSSATIYTAQHHFEHDNYTGYKTTLYLLFGLGVLFLAGQLSAWLLLFSSGYSFTHNAAAYLYVISGLHALHIIGGLVFLGFFMLKSRTALQNYATSVVYFTDPVIKSQLALFAIFWHFLGLLWLYLLFFFLLIN
jgi:cytochrome c oxidase subunit III